MSHIRKIVLSASLLLIAVALLWALLPFPRTICRWDAAQMLVRSVAIASEQYHVEFSAWPQSLTDLNFRTQNPCDPWKNPLVYMPFNTESGYGLVISWGADGKPGGTGKARDRIARFPEQ